MQTARSVVGRMTSVPADAASTHWRLVDALRQGVLDAVTPLVRGARRVALLDFPDHSNVGDSAIWLGALTLLRASGLGPPVYCCDAATYDRRRLARAIGDGTILFTGGGSFGDLWERHLRFREQVVADFPTHRIIQLPESVHFERAESLARARAVFDAHPDVTILVRDAESLSLVQREFRAASALVPDLAFGLGRLTQSVGVHRQPVLWLKRDDKEDRFRDARPGATVDWIAEPVTPLVSRSAAIRRRGLRWPWLRPLTDRQLQRAFPALATERLDRGVALLSSGRVVVTDRLHGHILSCMLGIPHVVLDNSYGKVHRFARQWTSTSPLVRLASTLGDAQAQAQSLLTTFNV